MFEKMSQYKKSWGDFCEWLEKYDVHFDTEDFETFYSGETLSNELLLNLLPMYFETETDYYIRRHQDINSDLVYIKYREHKYSYAEIKEKDYILSLQKACELIFEILEQKKMEKSNV